ncbi:hypothetical protein [Paracoccus binzhouensis]|uniref:hypothetical protein n=1 Tax=Paracoccus binzhouensis TaxID=2796149 RepID=UPI001E3EA8F1|nr:hypothetical protein [Paracoccus binzhouensis]
MLILSTALAAASLEGSWTRDAMIRDAKERLLNGEDLPPELDERLMRLPPADRIEVLIFLRRSGMMTGPGWTAERLLAPARTGESR